MRFPFGLFADVVVPGGPACADLATLRRRTYIMLVVSLPGDWALICGRLPL